MTSQKYSEDEIALIGRFLSEAQDRISAQPQAMPFKIEYGNLVVNWLRALASSKEPR